MVAVDIASVPSLGSSLLAARGKPTHEQQVQLPTGCKAIDEVLDGGLSYSTITTIASSASNTRSLVGSDFYNNCTLY